MLESRKRGVTPRAPTAPHRVRDSGSDGHEPDRAHRGRPDDTIDPGRKSRKAPWNVHDREAEEDCSEPEGGIEVIPQALLLQKPRQEEAATRDQQQVP